MKLCARLEYILAWNRVLYFVFSAPDSSIPSIWFFGGFLVVIFLRFDLHYVEKLFPHCFYSLKSSPRVPGRQAMGTYLWTTRRTNNLATFVPLSTLIFKLFLNYSQDCGAHEADLRSCGRCWSVCCWHQRDPRPRFVMLKQNVSLIQGQMQDFIIFRWPQINSYSQTIWLHDCISVGLTLKVKKLILE